MKSIIVVTEDRLNAQDIENIVEAIRLEEPPATHVDLMVPYDIPQPLLIKVLDELALFRFDEARKELTEAEEGPLTQRAEAQTIADTNSQILQAAGLSVSTKVAQGQPLEGLKQLIAESDPSQAVFITRRYAIEDVLNIGWTNRAKDELGIPVLHFHTGSTRIED